MRKSWPTFVLVGGLAVLLAALGVLQYRWQTQISQTEGEKARLRVREQAERFAADFNGEVQNAYFNFQTDAESWRARDWGPFNERLEFFRNGSPYPDLITGFTYIDASLSGTQALKYDFSRRTFVEAEETEDVAAIRKKVSADKFIPVDPESLTLFLPIHEVTRKVDVILRRGPGVGPPTERAKMPDAVGHLAIQLDPEVIRNKLVSDLGAKYFSDGEYTFAITGTGGIPVHREIVGRPDASSPLFDLSTGTFVHFGNKELIRSISGEGRTATIDQHVESHTIATADAFPKPEGAVRIELKREAAPGQPTSVFTMRTRADSAPPWTLAVQHSSGSLDGFIASTLRQNLAIGFGVLLLLAAAVGAIIISAMRARALAERQLNFVSSVSHEFRTPLAVIYSAGENLADGVAKETTQISRYGNLIKGEGKKLSSMVEQILSFAGAKSGRHKFSFAPTTVNDIVNGAIDECRPLIEERKFTLDADLAAGLPTVNADPAALAQAVQNLIANSIKYSNGKAWLRIATMNGGDRVKITVEDRGIGISKGDLKQIFEPFFRAREVVDAQIHGNGLGLPLVKQIVEAHGGIVRAESEPGKGSRFTIELKSER